MKCTKITKNSKNNIDRQILLGKMKCINVFETMLEWIEFCFAEKLCSGSFKNVLSDIAIINIAFFKCLFLGTWLSLFKINNILQGLRKCNSIYIMENKIYLQQV